MIAINGKIKRNDVCSWILWTIVCVGALLDVLFKYFVLKERVTVIEICAAVFAVIAYLCFVVHKIKKRNM